MNIPKYVQNLDDFNNETGETLQLMMTKKELICPFCKETRDKEGYSKHIDMCE